MKLSITTDAGMSVRLAASALVTVDNAPGVEPGLTELCAVVDVGDEACWASGSQSQALPTRLGFAVDGQNVYVFLNVLSGRTLLFTILDLADALTQQLLLQAPQAGFGFAIVGKTGQKLLRVPVAHLKHEVATHSAMATRSDFEAKADFLASVLRRLNAPDGLQTIGLHDLAFDTVLVSFAGASGLPLASTGEMGGATNLKSLH